MDIFAYQQMPVGLVFKNIPQCTKQMYEYGLLLTEGTGKEGENVYSIIRSKGILLPNFPTIEIRSATDIAGNIINGYYTYLDEKVFGGFVRLNKTLLQMLGIKNPVRTVEGIEKAERTNY